MAISKIKGHRIEDKSIEQKHLHDNFNLPESRLVLNHPTHTNVGDLTEDQKNILTQRGNADILHYHTGGGGGPNGIYTNEERDVQILKLSMLINSTKHGMDKSVKDLFDDDASVYYGIRAAKSPVLVNITDDQSIGGLLLPNTSYTYGLAYKTLYGETDMINTSSITTLNGANNAVQLNYEDAPPENTGVKVFRSTGNVPKMIVENETVSEWQNPYNFDTDISSTDKTSGLGSYRVSVPGQIFNGLPSYGGANIAYGIGKRLLNDGQQLNVVVDKNAPFEYLIQIHNKAVVSSMDIVWDSNPANIPIDYEVYYTTDTVPTDVSKLTWKKFERLQKFYSMNSVQLSKSTDGAITGNYQITGNTRSLNAFTFKAVSEITAIRVIVKTLMSKCKLTDLRLMTKTNATGCLISKDFSGPQDFRDYKSLCLDVKSNLQHKDNLRVGFLPSTEVVGSIVTDWNYPGTDTQNLTGKIIRHNIRATPGTRFGYDRIRIQLRPDPSQYLRIENIYIMLETRSLDNNNTGSDADVQSVLVPVTFNGGLPYFDGTPTGDIYSDWCYINFPNYTFNAYKVTFKVVTGSLRRLNVSTSDYYTAPSDVNSGYESALLWNNIINFTPVWDYSFVSQIQVGKSNAQYMDLDYFDTTVCEKWHRHYVPMPTGLGAQDIRKLVLYFNNITADQDVFMDNIRLTRANDAAASATMRAASGCLNEANVKKNDNTFYSSDLTPTNVVPKSLMVEYATPQNINKLLLLFGERVSAGKNYALQYSIDNTANANDVFDSPKWTLMTNIIIGEEGIPQEFTGTIVNGIIYNNTVWGSHITHKFSPITCTKIRMVVFSTIGDMPLKIMNVRTLTADDTGTMSLIYDRSTPVLLGQKFIDDGKPTQGIYPLQFNQTGSFNVIYDNTSRVMRLIDPSQNGVLHLKEIDFGELFMHVILTAQYTGDCKFYISNNHGASYVLVDLDKLYSYMTQSENIRIKIELKSSDAMVSAVALLYSL